MYAVVFLDAAIHYKVKQDGRVVNKAAYMVVGVDLEGCKDVLGMWIGENESAKFWLNVLNELKSRGVQDILITSVDNLTGFSEAISACYPKTDIQKCVVHQIRNSLKYVSYKDYKAITAALKPIYKASTEEAARVELDKFEEQWGAKYPMVIRSWRNRRVADEDVIPSHDGGDQKVDDADPKLGPDPQSALYILRRADRSIY